MGTVIAFDVPPPGAGVATVIEAVPPFEMSAALIAAWRLLLETKVVGEQCRSTERPRK
jgi:hypothetical protein